jgi:hypothetical protein
VQAIYRVCLVWLFACHHTAPVPDTSALNAEANAAYDAHEFARCAALFARVAQAHDSHAGDALYNEACCEVKDGKPEVAFATFDRMFAAGFRDGARMAVDDDLVSLHGDARWAGALAKAAAVEAAYERTLKAPDVRRQLLAMVDEDQAQRNAWVIANKAGAGSAATTRLLAATTDGDRKRTAALQAIVAKLGWPRTSLVGDDGAHAAWLLVQHADLDPDFAKRALALMTPLAGTGEVDERDYAYLYDRVAVHDGRPQRWGTQFKDGYPNPIEDEAHVDDRRAKIGLQSMAAYKRQMNALYGSGTAK